MSEEELRAMLENLISRLDDVKKDIDEIKRDNKEAHKAFYDRLDTLEKTCIAREHIVQDVQKHIAEDKPFEDSFNKKLSQVLIFACASALSAVIGALVVKLWP